MLSFSASGWAPTSLDALANYAQLVGLAALIFAIVSLRHSATQIKQTARATQGQFSLAMDDLLAQHLETREEVSRANEWKNRGELSHADRRKFRRYLAVFERIGILVKDELMTIETVDALYGERFAMLLSRERIRQLVDGSEYTTGKRSNPNAWSDLIRLWWRLYMRWMPADVKGSLGDEERKMLTEEEKGRLSAGPDPERKLTRFQQELEKPPVLTPPAS
jgi:hypothetical protein